MYIRVEPTDGHELDRMITALLNATGLVHRVLETASGTGAASGVEIIGIAASQLRDHLTILAEQYADEELEMATRLLTHATLLLAGDLGPI
jgi:hypothetical protein